MDTDVRGPCVLKTFYYTLPRYCLIIKANVGYPNTKTKGDCIPSRGRLRKNPRAVHNKSSACANIENVRPSRFEGLQKSSY